MATLWYGHFDSTPEDERELLAEDWAKYIRAFVSDGIRNGGTCLQVTPGEGMNVNVNAGIANIQGYIFYVIEDANGAVVSVPVSAAHPSLPRIDRLILRLDRTIQARSITPMMLLGTADAAPVPPALTRDANTWEISLAQVRVNAGALTIGAQNITDERFNEAVCGLMHSVLGLDSSVWQAQFDAFMAALKLTSDSAEDARSTAFDTFIAAAGETAEAAQTARADAWDAFIDGKQEDYAGMLAFDFDNPFSYPGCTRTPTESGNTLTETITRNSDGTTLAMRVWTSLDNGNLVAVTTRYTAAGDVSDTITQTFTGDTEVTS